jgi:hypothetical protein
MIKSDRKIHDEFVQATYETSRKRIAELEGEIVNIKQKVVVSITAFTNRIAELEASSRSMQDELITAHKVVQKLIAQTEWVPVTERLPEIDENVFVRTTNGFGYGYYNGKFWWLDCESGGDEVTHWMTIIPPEDV